MEEIFKRLAASVALTVELAAAVVIAFGALEAIWGTVKTLFLREPNAGKRKAVWLRFGVWLLLGLEFELAADIVRTAIAPAWNDVGQLAAIALIRTFLNFFLEKDLEKYREPPTVPV
jgi:uncharacterized membrane protein